MSSVSLETEASTESPKESSKEVPKLLVAPLRFACVDPQIYRGSYPQADTLPFLQGLRLKTILSLTPEPLDITLEGVRNMHLECASLGEKSRKKRPVPVTIDLVEAALEIIEDPHMRPVYIHCLNGAQITGLIFACYRRRQQWSLSSTLAELERYSDHDRKEIQFIEDFSKDQTYFL